MRRAKKQIKPEIQRPEVYPGVFADVQHSMWYGRAGEVFWPGRVIFEGSERALRAAGLIRAGDRLPQNPRGMSGVATMRRGGELRLWRLEAEDVVARDRAFRRFMEAATAHSRGEQ